RSTAAARHSSSPFRPESLAIAHGPATAGRCNGRRAEDARGVNDRSDDMRSKILALALASLCAAPAWAADTGKGSKQEHIGLGSGAAIGAAAGGPVGLIVGAAFGAWLGDRFHEEKSGRLAAEGRYRDAAEEANALAAELRGTEQQLARTEAALAAEETAHRSDLASALDIELYFRTEQSELPPGAEERLATLAALVA